jgi:hypothetical protein
MNASFFLLFLQIVTSPAESAREQLGIFFGWGAFSEESPRKCFAITSPERGGPGSASVAFWPGRRAATQIHLRLSRAVRPGSAVLLRIDGRVFQMVGRGTDAWAANAAADAEIVGAIRNGLAMRLETRSAGGERVSDRYSLRGAPSAIDAAAIACAR